MSICEFLQHVTQLSVRRACKNDEKKTADRIVLLKKNYQSIKHDLFNLITKKSSMLCYNFASFANSLENENNQQS